MGGRLNFYNEYNIVSLYNLYMSNDAAFLLNVYLFTSLKASILSVDKKREEITEKVRKLFRAG